MTDVMKGRRKHVTALRVKDGSRVENDCPFEEIYASGGLSYRLVWNWAKLPPEIADYEIAGVCCGRDGCVYASTRAPGYPIAVFSPEGEWLRYMGRETPAASPHGIYVDGEDNVWLADREGHAAYQWDRNGRLRMTLGHPGRPSDTGINATVKGTRLIFHTEKRMAGPFNQPTRVVRAPNGDLYASDGYGNTAVHRFSPEGRLLQSWGGLGEEPGRFGIVHSLWADAWGRILVADRELDRVQVFDGSGRLLKALDGLLYPTDVAADDAFLYVAEREGRISIFNYDLELTAQIGYWLSPILPHSMAVDPQGNLFLGQLWGHYSLVKLERQDRL